MVIDMPAKLIKPYSIAYKIFNLNLIQTIYTVYLFKKLNKVWHLICNDGMDNIVNLMFFSIFVGYLSLETIK